MKKGDLVKAHYSDAIGLVVDVIQKKVARTSINNRIVNWDFIDPEPHAVVLYSHNDGTVNIPFSNQACNHLLKLPKLSGSVDRCH